MTVRNLAIDPVTGDFVLANGNLQLVSDAAAIRQAVTAQLKTFQGEWFLDPTLGVPYYQNVLIKRPDPRVLRQTFVNALLSVRGVKAVVELDLQFTPATRSLTVSWRVSTDLGLLVSGQTGV